MVRLVWFKKATGSFAGMAVWKTLPKCFSSQGDEFVEGNPQRMNPSEIAVYNSGPKDGPLGKNILTTTRRKLIEAFPLRLCIESPAFRQNLQRTDKERYWRMAWGGFLGHEADYNNKDCPPDRWLRIRKEQRIKVKPWRMDSKGYILIMLQKPGDAALAGCDTHAWGRDMIKELRGFTKSPIRVRPHPKDRGHRFSGPDVKVSLDVTSRGLAKDLAGARACVTYTSLSAIESVCEGIPTWTMHEGNLAYPVAHHDLSEIESPREFERNQWLNNLAYTQWSIPEFQKGLPWKHLKPVHFK